MVNSTQSDTDNDTSTGITDSVCEQMEEVRRSGETNMVMMSSVQRVAHELELHELVVWIDEHTMEEYATLLNTFRDRVQGSSKETA